MKEKRLTILIAAYAVHPQKGSEDGMGWRFILQAARQHRVIAFTRENNRPAIEAFLAENDFEGRQNLHFRYFDLPVWARWWKRGGRFSSAYHWLWHACLPSRVRRLRLDFDVAHHLNFHCDWTPAALWRLGKPFVWGPIGHHPPMPKDYLLETGGWPALIADRAKWFFKKAVWNLSPGLRASLREASTVFSMNSAVGPAMGAPTEKVHLLPSVGTDRATIKSSMKKRSDEPFEALFMGRFVALKGPETAMRAFAKFWHALSFSQKSQARLRMVGKGPLGPRLRELAVELEITNAVEWAEWLPFERISEAYARASVFLFPSHEGAGMVVAEALAHGAPVICYDNEGPGELTDDTCALRIKYRSHTDAIEKIAQGLDWFFWEPTMQAVMGRRAVEFFEKNLSWDGKETTLADAYARAARKGQTAQTHWAFKNAMHPLFI